MIHKWKSYQLKEVFNFYNGKKVIEIDSGKIPIYGSNGIVGHTDKSLFNEDIVIGRVGAYCGSIEVPKGDFWASDNTIVLKVKKGFDKSFLAYYLQTMDLNSYAGGSAQPLLTHGWLKPLKVTLPEFKTQQKIASILSAYDDLIENNLKRIKLLEEKAQLTYEEWFVRMKFPGHESVEIDKETGLPEGWEKVELIEMAMVITGKTPSTTKQEYYGSDVPFIKTPDLHKEIYMTETEQFLSDAGANSQKNKFFPKNTVLLACIGARAGAVGLTSRKSQCNQQINGLLCKKDFYTFYIYFFSRALTPLLRALGSNGATMTNVSKGKLEKVVILKPSVEIIQKFHTEVRNNFEIILNLQNQNQLLKEARDILLPRLMTGMIDPSEISGQVMEKLEMEKIKKQPLRMVAEPKTKYNKG